MLHKLKDKGRKYALFRYFYNGIFRLYCDHTCDYVMMSFPKSGHTWLRVLVAKSFALTYGLDNLDLDLVWMAKKNSKIPKVAISHGITPTFKINFDFRRKIFLGAYAESDAVKIRSSLKKKKIIFLVRDPKDVVVSLFFHLTKRNNFYVGSGMSHFIKQKFSLTKIIKYN